VRQDFFVVSRGSEGGLAENLHFLPAALKSRRIMATTDTERPCFAELEIIIILLRVETAKKECCGCGGNGGKKEGFSVCRLFDSWG